MPHTMQFRADPDAEDEEEAEARKKQREQRKERAARAAAAAGEAGEDEGSGSGFDDDEGAAGKDGGKPGAPQAAKRKDKLLTMDPKEITYEMVAKKLREIIMSRCAYGRIV